MHFASPSLQPNNGSIARAKHVQPAEALLTGQGQAEPEE